MLRVRVYENGRLLDGDGALLGTPGPKWIDVLSPTEEVLSKLAERYGLHKLAIEDCLHLDQRPKLEEYGDHQFLVLQGFSTPTKQLTIFASIFMPLSFIVGFFGQNFDNRLGGPTFFGVMLAAITAVPVTMIFWFRTKDWI